MPEPLFDEFPRFKAAAVQAAPVYLDPMATTEKACGLIREAAAQGASLIAFPEVFIAGYPYWNWFLNPVQGSAWYEKLYKSSVRMEGPEMALLQKSAREYGIHVVMGLNEKGASFGEIYNTMVFLSDEGQCIGRHRKLVPTWAEKLTWTGGDGSSLQVYPSKVGPVGMLACGENTNTLARFSLLAQGELVHIASYISLPVAPPDYNMAEAIRIRAAAHCFEGKLFTLVSCSTISDEIIDAFRLFVPDAETLLRRKDSAFTGILGPNGAPVSDPLIDTEGIVYAEIDLQKCIQPKQMHDILGHYNRFDIFDLRVNRRPLRPITFLDPEPDKA
jgi:aliphatic nitrilase